jgi:hypothetical protein
MNQFNKQPLQSFKNGELEIIMAGDGVGRSQLIIHKATFFWNDKTKKQQLTACGNYNSQDNRQVKSGDWDQVNCKRCLLLKVETPMSTMSLI